MLKNFKLPSFLKIENGILEDLSSVLNLENINYPKILFVTDDYIYEVYGKKLIKNLSDANYKINVEVIKTNHLTVALELSEKIIEEGIQCVIGLGGGKVLDTSKYTSFISKVPFISIPTALANDGIGSPISVLTMKNGKSKSIGSKVPTGIIIDLDIILKSPEILIKAGIGDTLSNYTAIIDWKLGREKNNDSLNDFSILLSELAFNSLYYFKDKDIKKQEFLKQLCESIVLSGLAMEIAGVSRPCSGSEHLFSHAIDLYYPEKKNLHGLQVGLGSIVTAYLQGVEYKGLINYLKELSIDVSPSNLNISYEEFKYAWKNARKTRENRYTILNEIELNDKGLNEIYNEIEEEFKR